jgi:beta-galactosidase
MHADGEDVSLIEVDAVDEAGRVVPTANDLVRFSVEDGGLVVGVGNGDPSSHEPDKATQRRLFNGHCMVLVRGAKPGPIRIWAKAEGLQDGRIALTVVR